MENTNFFFVQNSQELEFNVNKNEEINHAYLVISNSNIELKVHYNLSKEAKAHVKMIGLIYGDANAKLQFNSYSNSHNAEFTVKATTLGLNKSTSALIANSKVEKTIRNNKVNQKLTGLILSKHAKITGEPNLRIDTEEIYAQHALNIGSLNKEEMFYLQSKGISSSQAKKLIIWGLVTEVINDLDEETKQEYIQIIEKIMKENND